MTTKKLLCLASTIVLATAALGQAQSLVEAARLEKLRRQKLRTEGGPAKLYTDNDRTGSVPAPSSDGTAVPLDPNNPEALAPAAPKKKEKSPEELAADKQRDWAERVKKAQDEVKSLEDAISKNERTYASSSNFTPARAELLKTIESDKQRLVTLKQSVERLEDERRRAGLPRAR